MPNDQAVSSRELGGRKDRAYGALLGLAIGDALGMPTQSFSRSQLLERYGEIRTLRAATNDQPIAPNMPAGSVTDDTDQALILADLLISGAGEVGAPAFAESLLTWENEMREAGSLDLLGPSTKAALTALHAGQPDPGRYGTTNGAAMRIAPVGIAFPPGSRLLDAVVSASRLTHNTSLGISSAAAIGTAVSVGVEGGTVADSLASAVSAAREGEQQGHWEAGAHVAARFEALRPLAKRLDGAGMMAFLDEVVGTSVASQESVVAALLILDRYQGSPFEGLCAAASVGGDTDTMAAMAGAVFGACLGASSFPTEIRETVETVNELRLPERSTALLALRNLKLRESRL